MTARQHGIGTSNGGRADPRVSVILSTYNHEDYIGQAIEGVLAQSCEASFEFVILDDCSSDATGDVIESFAARHPGLIQVRRPPVNLNTNADFRRAVERARGEYLAFLDGDDYWTDPDKLRKQVAFLDENPGTSMCFHDCIAVDRDGQVVQDSLFRAGPPPAFGTYRDIARRNYVPGPSPLIRRSALAPLPDWLDPYHWRDWAIHLIAAEHGSIGFIPDRMAAYRIHPGGYWSGMSADKRFETTRRFLADFACHLPAHRARELESGVSSGWVGAFLNMVRAGDIRGVGRTLRIFASLAAGKRGSAFVRGVVRELSRQVYDRTV